MSASLAQCIAPLLAQYHQIVLVPPPRSNQDSFAPAPALPSLSALAGAASSAATIYDLCPAAQAASAEGMVEPSPAAASGASEQALCDEDAYLDSMLTALAQRKRPTRARVVSIPLSATAPAPIAQSAAVDGDCSENRSVSSCSSGPGALDDGSLGVRVGSSFAALMHSVLGAHSPIAWVYELMRAGFAAERASLWILCVSDELLLEIASASAPTASAADGNAWHSVLENAAALAAPGSFFLLVRPRNGECTRGTNGNDSNGVSALDCMSRHVAAILSAHQFSLLPTSNEDDAAALEEVALAVVSQFEVIVTFHRDSQ